MEEDIHSKATKLDPRQTPGPHPHPKCNNKAMVTCNQVHTPVSPLNTPNLNTAATLVQADTPPAGTSPVSKQHQELLLLVVLVVVMITTTSNKLPKPNLLAAPWLQQTGLVTGTVSKVKVTVKMGMVGTRNLVMHKDTINKAMVIRQLDIMRPLMVKLVHMVDKVIPLLLKLHHLHLELNLVMFSLRRLLLLHMVPTGLSRLLDMVDMDRSLLLLHQLTGSRRHSSLLMLPHKVVAMPNQLLIVVMGRRMQAVNVLLMVVLLLGMDKQHMGSSQQQQHMEDRMAVVTPSNLLHMPAMQLLRQPKQVRVAVVVVRLLKLHLSKVDDQVRRVECWL